MLTCYLRRKHRRIASTWLSQKAVDNYSPVLDRESRSLIKAIYDECDGGKRSVNPQVSQMTTNTQDAIKELIIHSRMLAVAL